MIKKDIPIDVKKKASLDEIEEAVDKNLPETNEEEDGLSEKKEEPQSESTSS